MQKGDKVKLVKACPKLDRVMKVSVEDIGICTCNPNDDMINVKFGKIKYPFIFCSRLKVVGDELSVATEKFNYLIDIAIKEYNSLYTDEIDSFLKFLRKKIMEVDE
jgi:hypothetical protein